MRWSNVLCGILIGITDLIPGVSGGTSSSTSDSGGPCCLQRIAFIVLCPACPGRLPCPPRLPYAAPALTGRHCPEMLRARSYTLAGELSVVPFADVIALLELTRKSGVLSLHTPSTSGLLYFDNGRVIPLNVGGHSPRWVNENYAIFGNASDGPLWRVQYSSAAGAWGVSAQPGLPSGNNIAGGGNVMATATGAPRRTDAQDLTGYIAFYDEKVDSVEIDGVVQEKTSWSIEPRY